MNPAMETRAARLCRGWCNLFLLLSVHQSSSADDLICEVHVAAQILAKALTLPICSIIHCFSVETLLFREFFSPAIFHQNPFATLQFPLVLRASILSRPYETHHIPGSTANSLQSPIAGRGSGISIPSLRVYVAL